jgi:hypothetical protein
MNYASSKWPNIYVLADIHNTWIIIITKLTLMIIAVPWPEFANTRGSYLRT